jgi:hypothetical protein
MQTLQAKKLSTVYAFIGPELHPKSIKPATVGLVRKHHLKDMKVYNHQWELINCLILPELEVLLTEGSYKVEPDKAAEILTLESIIRDKGKWAGGIVFFLHNTYTPIQCVQITSDQEELGINVFTLELLTQVIAIKMAQYQPHYLPGFFDCIISYKTLVINYLRDYFKTVLVSKQ